MRGGNEVFLMVSFIFYQVVANLMTTLYWHDYETWGIDPSVDRPSQFAGVRTDENLKVISDPLVLYCQPAPDVLPHPEACLVTGITPQHALKEGLKEHEFIARIHAEFSQSGTCGVGYNSIRFDDEVTRYTLYRNFYDPYEREWANGNSRWDIIDMVRLCHALRPEGIEWPRIDGKPSFRLENLTEANGISHASAHDAYSDVEATINMARLVKEKQPALYDYVYQNRNKTKAMAMIDLVKRKPLFHISSKFSSEYGCAGMIMPLGMHPTNKNAVIVMDLSADPSDLIGLSAEQVAERVFTSAANLPEGQSRIPLKAIHINKCPIIATPKLLDDKTAVRLNINKQQCEKNWQTLLQHDLRKKVQDVMSSSEFPPKSDPERQLYEGFIPKKDKSVMEQVRTATGPEIADTSYIFSDKRLKEMLWRYKARNFPEVLTEVEKGQWQDFCNNRLNTGDEAVQSVGQMKQRIMELTQEETLSPEKQEVLRQLGLYADDAMKAC